MLAARNATTLATSIKDSSSFVAYASKEAHSSVERATQLAGVQFRKLSVDEKYSLRGATLKEAILKDVAKGLTPFYVCCTLGTTSCCSFDNLRELGEICEEHGLWLHVDAAYAGSSFICEEMREPMDGIELAQSFNFNPHKWLHIQFDCSALWVRDKDQLAKAFVVDPLYLRHEQEDAAVDFRHWQIPLGRRFRSLKLWFVIRTYGVQGLKQWIRQCVQLAQLFQDLVASDPEFEIFTPRSCALVCFRAKGDNELNKNLLETVNNGRVIHITPSQTNEVYFLRFAICSVQSTADDVTKAYQLIAQTLHSIKKPAML